MSLIKCPECGKDVSTSASTCPHCGFPIAQDLKEKHYSGPDPLDSSWMEEWKEAPKQKKWILTFIFLGSVAILAAFIILVINTAANGYVTPLAIIGILFGGLISLIFFAVWIAGLIVIKYKIASCDGYNVIVVSGIFHNYLVIENKIFEKAHNRHLDGQLPNGRSVKADLAFWDSSIRITFDK